MKCYLCSCSDSEKVQGTVRDIPELSIHKCRNCGLVFLENFDHIDDSFYESSKMRDVAFDVWRSETIVDDTRRRDFLADYVSSRRLLDFGAGNGQFLKLCKESLGCSVSGVELDLETRKILESEDIICVKSLSDLKESYDVITAFHVIEHLKDPIQFLTSLKEKLSENGKIFLEFPNSDDALLSTFESIEFSKFTFWSCHLMLFNERTIQILVEKSGLRCNKITQIQRYPLSNHLYWLSKGKPGGHIKWSFMNDELLNKEYERILRNLKICDTVLVEVTR